MSATNDYRIQLVTVASLSGTDVLVGEAGGLSAVYDASSNYVMGCLAVETEHGTLLMGADDEVTVLHREGQ